MIVQVKTAVIVNPAAANGRVGRRIDRLAASLREVFAAYELLLTERPGHAVDLARQAIKDGCELVVSVGGDGTHNEVVNGFLTGGEPVNPEAALAIVPYGTGSDLARTLGLPRGPGSLEALAGAERFVVDVGRVVYTAPSGAEQERYFVNVADFGAGGAVVQRVNQTSKRLGGFLSFLYGVAAALCTYKNPLVRLEVDGEVVQGRINNVILANGAYYGGGMHVAPEARLDSGVFEVYLIGDIGRMEAFLNLPKLYRGRLLKRADKVRYFRARRVAASAEEEVLVNLDGEQPGRLPATFEILPRVLPILAGRR